MDERTRLLARIQTAADEVLGPGAMLLTESTALGDQSIDSLDLVEIMMIVEEQEDLVIETTALEGVADIAGLLDALQALTAPAVEG